MNQKLDYRSRFGLVVFYSNSHEFDASVIVAVLRIDSKII